MTNYTSSPHILTEDGWAYVAPAIGGGATSREWQRKFPSLWHAVSAASQDLLVAADLVRNKEVKARLMLHWDTVNGIAHALDRYARQPHSSVNQPDVNAPSLLEQGRLEEPRQLDQGMTSTSGDAQTSYPPVDCLNGTAREQLAREGSCNASSLERSGSIDAEVDNTTVPGTPSSQTLVRGHKAPRWRVFEDITHGWWGIEEDVHDGNTILYPKKVNREAIDGIVRAHNAALSAQDTGAIAGARVKPLQWDQDDTALTPLGSRYSVYPEYGRENDLWACNRVDGVFKSVEAAKAAAQADYSARILSALEPQERDGRSFQIGQIVRKKSGSWWEGRVVGYYSTEQTPDGVCVQLDKPMGPVQIYPASALELSPDTHVKADPALIGIAEEMKESGGHWQPCTGCYDTEDGHPTQKYDYSPALQTAIGCGCHECGGLGAIWWHMTDAEVADFARICEEVDTEHELKMRVVRLEAGLRRFRRAYVSLMETGRDRIVSLGGSCDPLEAMEAADPELRLIDAALATEGKV